MIEVNRIYHCDWMKNGLPDKCANLIIGDPPYFEVKGEFDFIWESFDDYLQDVERWAIECKRLLADNGTLFWYGHAKKIAYSQVIFDKYFNLENNITWEKKGCQTKKGISEFRCFAPVSERLLMYSNEISMTGLEYIDINYVSPRNPFRKELITARELMGLSTIQVAEIGKFYGKINHGGSVSNWESGANIPTKEQYDLLKTIIPLRREYEDLRREYEDLRREYEDLRRPFNNYLKLFDVMRFDQETHITGNYEHDTCKPETLTRALILTCSRPGDLVLVPFAGSGTECAMAAKENRRFIGYDVNEKYVAMSNKRSQRERNKLQLNLAA